MFGLRSEVLCGAEIRELSQVLGLEGLDCQVGALGLILMAIVDAQKVLRDSCLAGVILLSPLGVSPTLLNFPELVFWPLKYDGTSSVSQPSHEDSVKQCMHLFRAVPHTKQLINTHYSL